MRRIIGTALAPVFQGDEGESRIGTITGEAEALNGDDILDRRFSGENLFDLLNGRGRAVGTGFRWSLNIDDQEALVFIRHESAWQTDEEIAEAGNESEIDDHHPARTARAAGGCLGVAMGQAIEFAVEPAAKATFFVMPFLDGLEEGGAKGRCQR